MMAPVKTPKGKLMTTGGDENKGPLDKPDNGVERQGSGFAKRLALELYRMIREKIS